MRVSVERPGGQPLPPQKGGTPLNPTQSLAIAGVFPELSWASRSLEPWLGRVDMPMLEAMSIQYARAMQARRVLRSEGLFTSGSVGQLREHPAVKIEREATTLFARLAEQFALTPASRSRLGMAELHRRSL